MRPNCFAFLAAAVIACWPSRAAALDQLCDSAFAKCRTPLLDLKAENVAIDVGMWFMEDARFSAEIIRRKQAGAAVRIIMDPRSNVQHPNQPAIPDQIVISPDAYLNASPGQRRDDVVILSEQQP